MISRIKGNAACYRIVERAEIEQPRRAGGGHGRADTQVQATELDPTDLCCTRREASVEPPQPAAAAAAGAAEARTVDALFRPDVATCCALRLCVALTRLKLGYTSRKVETAVPGGRALGVVFSEAVREPGEPGPQPVHRRKAVYECRWRVRDVEHNLKKKSEKIY